MLPFAWRKIRPACMAHTQELAAASRHTAVHAQVRRKARSCVFTHTCTTDTWRCMHCSRTHLHTQICFISQYHGKIHTWTSFAQWCLILYSWCTYTYMCKRRLHVYVGTFLGGHTREKSSNTLFWSSNVRAHCTTSARVAWDGNSCLWNRKKLILLVN